MLLVKLNITRIWVGRSWGVADITACYCSLNGGLVIFHLHGLRVFHGYICSSWWEAWRALWITMSIGSKMGGHLCPFHWLLNWKCSVCYVHSTDRLMDNVPMTPRWLVCPSKDVGIGYNNKGLEQLNHIGQYHSMIIFFLCKCTINCLQKSPSI